MVKPGTPKLTLVDYPFDRTVDPDSFSKFANSESGSAARSKRQSKRTLTVWPSRTTYIAKHSVAKSTAASPVPNPPTLSMSWKPSTPSNPLTTNTPTSASNTPDIVVAESLSPEAATINGTKTILRESNSPALVAVVWVTPNACCRRKTPGERVSVEGSGTRCQGSASDWR
eukprot:1175864-Prorocentrum_minimum.AAC.2